VVEEDCDVIELNPAEAWVRAVFTLPEGPASAHYRNKSNERKDRAVPTETTSIEDVPTATSEDDPTPRVNRRKEQLAAATGILFVVLQVPILFIVGGAPAIDDPPSKIRNYLVNEGGRILLATTLGALAAFFSSGSSAAYGRCSVTPRGPMGA
jgi:hypothetical protein